MNKEIMCIIVHKQYGKMIYPWHVFWAGDNDNTIEDQLYDIADHFDFELFKSRRYEIQLRFNFNIQTNKKNHVVTATFCRFQLCAGPFEFVGHFLLGKRKKNTKNA